MVYFMENPIKMDDLGGTIMFGNIYIVMCSFFGGGEIDEGAGVTFVAFPNALHDFFCESVVI